jgi:hypothetical protein
VRWSILLVLAACGTAADEVAVVRGRVEISQLAAVPVEVQALHDGEIRSAAALDEGRFLLAVPPGEAVSLALVDARGDTVAWLGADATRAAVLQACDAGVIELGPLTPRPGACLQSDACRSALSLRAECLGGAARTCAQLEPEVTACLDRRRDACTRARLALKACDPEGQDLPECERERYLAATCDGAPSCDELAFAYWARCGFPCGGLEALVGRTCSRCEREDLVFTAAKLPACEDAP